MIITIIIIQWGEYELDMEYYSSIIELYIYISIFVVIYMLLLLFKFPSAPSDISIE